MGRTMYSLLVILTLTSTHALPLTEQEVPGLDDNAGISAGKTNDLEATMGPEEYLKHKPNGRPGHGYGNVAGYRPGNVAGYGYRPSGLNAGYTGGYNNGGYNVFQGYPSTGYNYGGYNGYRPYYGYGY